MTKMPADLRSLARAHTELGVKVLAGIAKSGRSESARVSAIALLWERGWGKAVQPIAGEDGGPLRVVIRQIIENAGDLSMKTIEHELKQLKSDEETASCTAQSQPDER